MTEVEQGQCRYLSLLVSFEDRRRHLEGSGKSWGLGHTPRRTYDHASGGCRRYSAFLVSFLSAASASLRFCSATFICAMNLSAGMNSPTLCTSSPLEFVKMMVG